MKLKSEAHVYLPMLFKCEGVPPSIVVDNSKEKSLVKLATKCREDGFHLVDIDPYYSWMMAAKGCIKQLNQGLSRKMLKLSSPKRLWDHCIELEALIRSNTALDIYGIECQVPETVRTGQTVDNSNLCEYEWLQCVMYYQPKEGYPDDSMALGRYLGPAIDVSNAITYKMLLMDGNYVYCSAICTWTPVEE